MPIFLQIMLGSAFGGLMRFLASTYLPFPILFVNILGSFLIGFFTTKFGLNKSQLGPFINTGVLGGLTTFSTFSLEAVNYLQSGKILSALIYVTVSVFFSILACMIGLRIR
jgi:CrcB protein